MVAPSLWLLLACSGGPQDPVSPGAEPGAEDTAQPGEEDEDYVPGVLPFDADAAAAAVEEALQLLFTRTAGHPIAGYHEAMEGKDASCPNYFDTELGHSWDGSCTAESGTRYAGAFTSYTYVDMALTAEHFWYFPGSRLDLEGTRFTGDGMIGQAAIDVADGSRFRAAGLAVILVGTREDGRRQYLNLVSSPVIWADVDEGGTWQDQGADLVDILAVWKEQGSGGWTFETEAALGGLAGPYSTVTLWFMSLPSSSTSECTLEPRGELHLREATTGYWYEVVFDAVVDGVAVPEACDGCAPVSFDGEEVGELCADYTKAFAWEEAPW